MVPNASKQYKTYQNLSIGSNGVDKKRSLQKILTRLRGTSFCIICTISARFYRVLEGNKTVPNAPKEYKMHQNMSSGSNGVDRERSLRKIPTRLRGTNFCINRTISVFFAPSFVSPRNSPKSIRIVRHIPKHEFRVQWGGSGAFATKNFDATSWHELLHQFSPF